jgi:hypothetical protein
MTALRNTDYLHLHRRGQRHVCRGLRVPAGAALLVSILWAFGAVGVSQAGAADVAAPAANASPTSPSKVVQPMRRGLRGRARRYQLVEETPRPGTNSVQPSAAPQPTVAAQPPAVAKPDPYGWKDLFDGKTLGRWKSAEFGGEGKVYVKDGMLVMEMGNSMTGVSWTGELPRDNYELTLEGMRLDGSDFFCSTTFPVGKDPCTLVVGGWGGTVVGLSNVDYYDASDNPTSQFMSFKDKQWYDVRLRVSTSKIEAWIDNEQVVNQPRADHKFGIRMECDLCQPLGICTWCTEGAVRNIRMRQLSPEVVKAIAEGDE